MKKLLDIQKINVEQVDIDNAEGKRKCPIYQSIKREYGIETKVNRDCITSLFDRACFRSSDYVYGLHGYIGVTQDMRSFMAGWDQRQSALPTSFDVETYVCKENEMGYEIIVDYYYHGASYSQRQEIEKYLDLSEMDNASIR